MENKIITFFEDAEHTVAQSPTTVAEAVKFGDSLTLQQKISQIESKLGLTVTKVWTNASPGTQALSTISVDLSNYKAILLEFRARGDNAGKPSYTSFGVVGSFVATYGGNGGNLETMRKYAVSTSGLTLSDSYSGYYTEYGVPTAIYGLR